MLYRCLPFINPKSLYFFFEKVNPTFYNCQNLVRNQKEEHMKTNWMASHEFLYVYFWWKLNHLSMTCIGNTYHKLPKISMDTSKPHDRHLLEKCSYQMCYLALISAQVQNSEKFECWNLKFHSYWKIVKTSKFQEWVFPLPSLMDTRFFFQINGLEIKMTNLHLQKRQINKTTNTVHKV